MSSWTKQNNKYSTVFANLGCKVERVGDDLIIDDKYKLNLPTSHFTNLNNGEKGRGVTALEHLIKQNKIV